MVSVTKNNTPALRFDGFDDEWGENTLEQLFEYGGSGGTPAKSRPEFYGGHIPFLGIADIKNRVITHTDKTITELGLKKSAAWKVPAGAISLAMYASVGRVGITGMELATSQAFYNMVFSEDAIRSFVYTHLEKMELMSEWEVYISTGTQRNLNAFKVRTLPIKIPSSYQEQRAIGELFADLDALIEQHRAKHANLQQTKTALMQRMFPQDGADEPELRLGGFSGKWGTSELQDLADKFTDGDWIESKDQSTGGIRLLQTGNVGVSQFLTKAGSEKWVSESTFHRLRCEEVLPGDILISRLPEPAGRACKVPALPYKMITAVDCTIVRTDSSNDPDFILAYLSTTEYFDSIRLMLAGGTRQRVSRSNLATIPVPTPPTLEEQRAIGEIFADLDALIAAESRYIMQLTQAKTALLQRMFV